MALKPGSKRPKRVRAPAWCPQIMAEIKRLRQSIPNLGKEKVFAKLVAFCQQHGLVLQSVSTIGRMIASAPDKLRTSEWQTNSRGQRKRFTRAAVTRKPKGVQLQPLECLAFDMVIRQREGIKRYILTAIDPKHTLPSPTHRPRATAHMRQSYMRPSRTRSPTTPRLKP